MYCNIPAFVKIFEQYIVWLFAYNCKNAVIFANTIIIVWGLFCNIVCKFTSIQQ